MKSLISIAVIAAVLLLSQLSAEGSFKLRLTGSAGPTTVTIEDQIGGDLNGSAGSILWVGSVDGWTVNVAAALSKPFLGSPANPVLDITYSVTHTSGAAATTLTIESTDTGFTPLPGYPLLGTINGNAIGTGLTGTYEIFYDNTNTEFGTTTGSLAANFGGGSYMETTGLLPVAGAIPYSITQRLVFSAPLGVTTTGDAKLEAVPEPATIGIFSVAGIGLGLIRFSRRRK